MTPNLCTRVTVQNNGNEQAAFNALLDWKMQDPPGRTRDATLMGATTENLLGAGKVAPGGTAQGMSASRAPQSTPAAPTSSSSTRRFVSLRTASAGSTSYRRGALKGGGLTGQARC
ncbi:hypothetical protein MPRI_29470 [Mycobacterium paraintracellulare]|uniref:Uncharacterized protein n=1 Tax=Mycobacterium paraintracellulare TaxID=1138383 RepID=A0ABM7K9J8_9MYCO|nr:hypothetical protein MPRI_29470 [Mycobacterium paraintracellulare]BCP09122.1 hypothetical protein MINTM020_12200 [Mycobacterium paraintracellulare]